MKQNRAPDNSFSNIPTTNLNEQSLHFSLIYHLYFKNFFDRITADLSFYYKCNPRDNKPNYNAFYKDRTLVAFYTEIYNSEVIIKTAHKLRNANPISHASSELLDRNSTTRDLKQSIDDLTKIIFDYVGFRMK